MKLKLSPNEYKVIRLAGNWIKPNLILPSSSPSSYSSMRRLQTRALDGERGRVRRSGTGTEARGRGCRACWSRDGLVVGSTVGGTDRRTKRSSMEQKP